MHGKKEKSLIIIEKFRNSRVKNSVKFLFSLSLSLLLLPILCLADRHDQSGNEFLRTFVEHFEIRGSSEGIGGHRSNGGENFLDGRRTGVKNRGTVEQRAVGQRLGAIEIPERKLNK